MGRFQRKNRTLDHTAPSDSQVAAQDQMTEDENEITSLPHIEPMEVESTHTTDSRKERIRKRIIKVLRYLSAIAGSLAVGGGLGVGCVLRLSNLSFTQEWMTVLALPGEVLERMFAVLALPLVVATVISASCQLKTSTVSVKFVSLLLLLYLSSSLVGAAVGAVAVLIIQPGPWTDQPDTGDYVQGSNHWLLVLLDFIRNAFPENLLEAYFRHEESVSVTPAGEEEEDSLVLDLDMDQDLLDPVNVTLRYALSAWQQVPRPGLAFLGVVLTHSVFGLTCSELKGQLPAVMATVVNSFQTVIIKMADLVLWYFPIGVFFMCACDVLNGEIFPFSPEMVLFTTVLLAALAVHGLLLVVLVYWLLVRKNPLVFLKEHWTALLVAFGTRSCLASLPFALKSARKMFANEDSLAKLLLCLGASFNLDGSAIYASASTLLLIQMNGIPLSFEHYLFVGLVAFPLSFVSTTLQANGVVYIHQLLITQMSTQQMDQLMSVEYIVGRTRAAINLLSDVVTAAVMQHYFADPPAKTKGSRRLRRNNSTRSTECRKLLVSQNLEQAGIHAAYANESAPPENTDL